MPYASVFVHGVCMRAQSPLCLSVGLQKPLLSGALLGSIFPQRVGCPQQVFLVKTLPVLLAPPHTLPGCAGVLGLPPPLLGVGSGDPVLYVALLTWAATLSMWAKISDWAEVSKVNICSSW